jgi:glyoxylase-like metal-dependent hydrolase (beta-lactamase superfamily II)
MMSTVTNGGWDARVRAFRAGDEVDTFAVVTSRFVVLVDTMATPAMAAGIATSLAGELDGQEGQEGQEQREKRGLLVVNTHADWDHCWGNAAFAVDGPYPAPIVGHELARQWMLSDAARTKLEERQAQEPRFSDVRLVPPEITFSEGLRISGGDLTLELLPTPGHTPDHVSVWIPEIRLLLAGDAAEHPFPMVHSAEDLHTLLASLRRLQALGAVVVLPCHGGTSDAGLPARNLAYFAAVERHVRAVVEEDGLPVDWAERDDLPALVRYPYEKAIGEVGSDPAAVPGDYREFHLAAVRATVGLVLGRA